MPTVWRLVDARYVDEAFTGEGARLHGSRWTSPGRRVVFCAATPALAVLELLTHVPNVSTRFDLTLFRVEIPGRIEIEVVRIASLPAAWRDPTMSPLLQPRGDAWLQESRVAVLEVPSVIVPMELNFALNPSHPEFQRIDVSAPERFDLDRRLVR